jgi:hypothetical protein
MAVIMTQEEQLHLYSFAGPFWAHWPVERPCKPNRNYSYLDGWRDTRRSAGKKLVNSGKHPDFCLFGLESAKTGNLIARFEQVL